MTATPNVSIINDYGKAQDSHGDSALTLAATAQVAAVLLLVQAMIAGFILLRRHHEKGLAVALRLAKQADADVAAAVPGQIHLDFMRYLLALTRLFGVASILLLPILLPANLLQPQRNEQVQGLDRLSYINIPSSRSGLLWVHLLMLAIFTSLCCAMIHAELVTQTSRDAAIPEDRPAIFIVGCVHGDMDEGELLDAILLHFPSGIQIKPIMIEKLAYLDPQPFSSILNEIEHCIVKQRDSVKQAHFDCSCPRRPISTVSDPPSLVRLLRKLRQELEVASSFDGTPQVLLVEVSNVRDRDFIKTLSHKRLHFAETLHDLSDVAWSNVVRAFSPASRPSFLRQKLLQILPALAAVFLALPVSFQGLFAYLEEFIGVIWKRPSLRLWSSEWVASYFRGVLPQSLALLFVYFSPIVIRRLVTSRRFISSRDRDLACAKYLFLYLYFQVFVFVSFSTTITAALSFIVQRPDEIPELFSLNLPKAGNYFLSYIIIQGLTLAVVSLLDWKHIVGKYVLSRLSVQTMRQRMMLDCPTDIDWVVLFPTTTLLAIIGMYNTGRHVMRFMRALM
ncbi:Hypothetical protein D9617_46g064400 [Elsinoe fawcettii]|nr:Hypothetical protein D9617_46g064400 [Elsinoe fawcettii]